MYSSALVILTIGLAVLSWTPAEAREISIQPNFQQPPRMSRLCKAVALPANKSMYIVGSRVDGASAHTLLEVHACAAPGFVQAGKPSAVWACGSEDSDTDLDECVDGRKPVFIHEWGHAAETLPVGYGYEVGADAGLPFLVLSSYYLSPQPGQQDNVSFHLTVVDKDEEDQVCEVHSLMLRNIDMIPGRSRASVENFYVVENEVSLQPLKFAIHTHAAGSSGEMWVVGLDGAWSRIGGHTKSPDEDFPSNVFDDVENPDRRIVKGDIIALRCIITNEREMQLELGFNYSDMCRGYLLYGSMDGDQLPVDSVTNDNVHEHAFHRSWLDHPRLRPRHQDVQPL